MVGRGDERGVFSLEPPAIRQLPVVGRSNRRLHGRDDGVSLPTCNFYGFNRNMIMTSFDI